MLDPNLSSTILSIAFSIITDERIIIFFKNLFKRSKRSIWRHTL